MIRKKLLLMEFQVQQILMVELQKLSGPAEVANVRRMIERHEHHTGSALAQEILAAWDEAVHRFVKVMPRDFQRMLEAFARVEARGLTGEEAALAAFREGIGP